MKKNKSRAVALRFDGINAPKVTAKGEGVIARQIIAAAKAHGIPIEQNKELTEVLAQVRINDEIPEALYTAVAQILAFLYYVDSKKPRGWEEKNETGNQ